MIRAGFVLRVFIAAVVIFGPAMFMASSPCVDCDGVCGAAATPAPLDARIVLRIVPVDGDARPEIPEAPTLASELPPRPLLTTV